MPKSRPHWGYDLLTVLLVLLVSVVVFWAVPAQAGSPPPHVEPAAA